MGVYRRCSPASLSALDPAATLTKTLNKQWRIGDGGLGTDDGRRGMKETGDGGRETVTPVFGPRSLSVSGLKSESDAGHD